MKKLFLFVAIAAMSLSCSKDDDNNDSSHKVSLKMNGTTNTFDDVTVEDLTDYLYVVAENGTKSVSFYVFPATTGANAFSGLEYTDNADAYFQSEPFTSNVTTNSITGNALKGTFSGAIEGIDGEGNPISGTITDGKFDFTY